MTGLLVALGAAGGAPLRFALASWLDSEQFPTGTWLVNVVGSFLLGLLSGLALGGDALALLGTGFCGGFTTYSAFAVQAHRLGAARGMSYGASYVVATVVASLGACVVGFVTGQA